MDYDVITTYYPNPNPNQQNNPKCSPRILNPNRTAANSRKGRLFAAVRLGLGIFDTTMYLNRLIREPGELLARRPSLNKQCLACMLGRICISQNLRMDFEKFNP